MRKSVYGKERLDVVTKFAGGAIVGGAKVGDRQIRVVVSTPTPDRVGDLMEPMGCDLRAFRKNPIVLRDHNRSKPIGTATVDVSTASVQALITFAPEGVSDDADEVCALVKAGVVSAVSPGFIPLESSPRKGGGMHIKSWELLEISIVTCPANSEAIVLERSLDPEAARRRREIEILGLKAGEGGAPCKRSVSAHERLPDMSRFAAKARPIYTGDPVGFTHDMTQFLQREGLKRSALAYDRDPNVQRADRLREIEKLRRLCR